ncbi:hypothetical protein HanPSC8_Chr17g0762811 [Helianthus annuus]|nr:hypothetical protein HanPSC8_Chr17g0762811 [Helianthus annuus]
MNYLWVECKKNQFFLETLQSQGYNNLMHNYFFFENTQSTHRVAAGCKTVSNSTNATQPSSTTNTDSTQDMCAATNLST